MFEIKKAEKKDLKLRMALCGLSGSGKTYTALEFATALNNGGGILVVDTENGSASRYADDFDFYVAEMSNYHPKNYVKAINEAVKHGFDVVVLDSISPAWEGRGGVLEIVGGNFANWKNVKPIENEFFETIRNSRIHVIATMRQKKAVEVTKNDRGKVQPQAAGLKNIQREGIEYEFDIVANMDLNNSLVVEKTRCKAINGTSVNQPDQSFMAPIIEWLGASDAAPTPTRQQVETFANEHGGNVTEIAPEDNSNPANFDRNTMIEQEAEPGPIDIDALLEGRTLNTAGAIASLLVRQTDHYKAVQQVLNALDKDKPKTGGWSQDDKIPAAKVRPMVEFLVGRIPAQQPVMIGETEGVSYA